MKVKPEHYDALKRGIAALNREQVLAHKALGLGKDKAKRFWWDLLYVTKQGALVAEIYKYADDVHLDTALRKILKELGYN